MLSLYVRAQSFFTRAKNFFGKKEEGATMVEYAIMVALIAIVCIVAVTAVGTEVRTTFEHVQSKLSTVNSATP